MYQLTTTFAVENFVSIDVQPWQWLAFVALVITLLVVDLLVIHRKPKVITLKEAVIESAVWISIGLSFTFVILWWFGGQASGEYLAGYLIEQSLSLDNVFVWAVVLAYFGIPRQYQFRVLFWGIFGAFVFRAALIFAGVALIEAFDWLLYFFGAFLIFTAFRIARQSEVDVHPESNVALRLVRKVVPSTNNFNGQHLFTVENGKRLATPLFAALIINETTDIVFAIDSIPAILAVTREQFIVFSSNAFAILGLRALYFGLADLAGRFRYLNTGLGVILGFVGVKMLLTDVVHIPTWASLAIIPIVLTVSIVASIRAEKRDHDVDEPPGERETVDATRNPD